MKSQKSQAKPASSADALSQKDAATFKNMMDLYNNKNYKKALKVAESLLAKYPEHGETLSVKALLLVFIDPSRQEEAIEIAKRGLRNGINSYLCWHVLGVIYKQLKNYRDTVKCFIMALKLDPQNDRLTREICCLQLELGDYAAFRRFGSSQLKLRAKEYREWVLFAFAHHLCGSLEIACEVMDEADRLFTTHHRVEDYELSEAIMYRGMLLEYSGKFERCAEVLEDNEQLLKDKLSYLELKAKALYLAKKHERAHRTYKQLLELNPNNARFAFMLFLTHPDERVRSLFWYPFEGYEAPETGSIYDQKLKVDAKQLAERKMEAPADQDFAFLMSEELLDLDGEYSCAGWNLESRLYRNFDRYINSRSVDAGSPFRGCHSYPEYALRASRDVDLSSMPHPDSITSPVTAIQVAEEYLAEFPRAGLVTYGKYRRFLKRDKYPLYLATRKLRPNEEALLLEKLEELGLRDPFTHACFELAFASGLTFYQRARKYVVGCLTRGGTNLIKAFAHCLTFDRAFVLLFILHDLKRRLLEGEALEDLENTPGYGEATPRAADHRVAVSYRLHLVLVFLAKLYDFLGAYTDALEALDRAAEVAPTSVDVVCLRGKVLRHRGDFARSRDAFVRAHDIDRSERQTSAKAAKAIMRTHDFDAAVIKWRSFLTEDVCRKQNRPEPPEIPSLKFELMHARGRLELFVTARHERDHEAALGHLKAAFARYAYVLEAHDEMYRHQYDFHNYCLNRMALRVYFNFLRLRNVNTAQGYYLKALKGAIRAAIALHALGAESAVPVEDDRGHRNLSYCLKAAKAVLGQRVYDPGLSAAFYRLAKACGLSTLFRLQCVTRCFHAARGDTLHHTLFPIVFDLTHSLGDCLELEAEMLRKTLALCVDPEVALEGAAYAAFAEAYLEHVLARVLAERYDLKTLAALVECALSLEGTRALDRAFENAHQLYRDATFREYHRFRLFLMDKADTCGREEHAELLRRQMDSLRDECRREFIHELPASGPS